MALAQEDIIQIEALISNAIASTPEVGNANVRYELDLRERTIRVEEELKHQRELMLTGFSQMEKCFEQVDKRFEQVDKRFEQMVEETKLRFEQLAEESNRRFEQVERRFEQIDKRFEQVDKRFEQVDKRFEQIDKQLEKQNQAIMGIHQEIKNQMRWSFGMLVGIGGLLVGVLKVIG